SERQNAWGILFKKHVNQNITDNFKKDFDELLLQLNNLIITRLHQEIDIEKRTAIKDFPVQFDQLKDRILDIVLQLAEKTLYCDATDPTAIYFTSSLQEDYSLDFLKTMLASKLIFDAKKENIPHKKSSLTSRSYFIHGIFSKILQQPAPNK